MARETAPHVLAADVGGTHTRLALERAGQRVAEHTTSSREHAGLAPILRAFMASAGNPPVAAACLAIAGPVIDAAVRITNLPWQVDAAALRDALRIPRVRLVNDLEAAAFGMLHLPSERFAPLQRGTRQPGSGVVLVAAAGTGFGLAALAWDGHQHHPYATEAGHAGYAARTPREIALLHHLQRRHGRVSIERVVSGPGLAAIHDFLRAEAGAPEPPELRAAADRSQAIAEAAAARRDPICEEALAIFCESYGAAVGDAALAHLATGGVWLGGGIAPKILTSLRAGGFLAAFLDKGRLRPLLESLPVAVCLAPDTALAGACRLAARDAQAP